MNNQDYFNDENYTGNHLHVDNWKYEFTPYIEAIAWVRKDSSMDLFFNDFAVDKEFQALFSDKEYYYNELMGVFLGRELNRKERIFSLLMVSSIYHCINVTSLLISIFHTPYLDVNALTFEFAMITL
ncbi:hypothetical protein P4601_07175 [Peribacillus frigoritolerans]|uniref:hypothetical protein n=1 Tax=Peribacillus frigoritolerans TaxID=450367 RepID=UPI000BAC85C4|nr:hypothetical protein [Peribacillus frigoritolerans]MED3889720.1 hypothetical protein [Peribacillus frigoritolerans]PAW26204.1 hypothetical protein BKC07_26110 [Peribacillus simplex]